MIRRFYAVAALVTIVAAVSLYAQDAKNNHASKAWNTVCPVTGDDVDSSIQTVSHDGKEYGFCCKGCVSKFKKEPAKYSKNLNEDGTTFNKVPGEMKHEQHKHQPTGGKSKAWNEVCPVLGGKVNAKTATVSYDGKEIGFCCGGCDTKFEKEPAKYMKNLSEDGKKFIGKKKG